MINRSPSPHKPPVRRVGPKAFRRPDLDKAVESRARCGERRGGLDPCRLLVEFGDFFIDHRLIRWARQTLEPNWQITEGHVIQIDGLPTVRTTLEYLPPPDFEATTFADFMVLGMIMTAMPAINAIPGVVAAPPGIVTYNDLPLPLPKGASLAERR